MSLYPIKFLNSANFIVIVGDLNFNCFKDVYCVHPMIKFLEDSYDLCQIIRSPTRVTPDTSTLLDVIMCTSHLLPVVSNVYHVTLSDHFAVYCVIKTQKNKQPPLMVRTRNYKRFKYDAFIHDLHITPSHLEMFIIVQMLIHH